MNMRSMLRAGATLVAAMAVATAAAAASGEVTKVDKAKSRVTLKHSGIRNLDMPPMTMVFNVRPPQLLESVAVGDRVRFEADRIDGIYTVTALTKAP